MRRRSKVVPFRTKLTKPSVHEKILMAELSHVKKRAREALYKYARHLETCPGVHPKAECTCHLYDAINGFHEE
jgi:hypothetical protein